MRRPHLAAPVEQPRRVRARVVRRRPELRQLERLRAEQQAVAVPQRLVVAARVGLAVAQRPTP